jgi:hypothetical protein
MDEFSSSSETLSSLLQRSIQAKPQCLDKGIIDISSRLTLIELNDSDQDAVYHYIAHLIRKIIGISHHFSTASDDDTINQSEDVNRSIANPVNDALDSKNDIVIVSDPVFYLDDEDIASHSGRVIILDELLVFDINHFVRNCPSREVLRDVKILQETDSFSCFGESFYSKEVFLSDLERQNSFLIFMS